MHYTECCDATFHGIHKWYVAMFEKLGWMLIAKEHGMNDKTSMYKHELIRLMHTIEKKMHQVKDIDKKHDLQIMYENIKILCDHAEKDL
jgi:hypothetical protein